MDRRRGFAAAVVAVVGVGAVALGASAASPADGGSVWVLHEVVAVTNDERWVEVNEHPSFRYEYSAGRGVFSVTTTYIGPDDDQWTPPKVHGEGITLHGSFSTPASRLVPGDAVSVEVELWATGDTQSFYQFDAWATSELYFLDLDGGWVSGPIYFLGPDDSVSQRLQKALGDYAPVSNTLTGVVPGGAADRQLVLRQTFHSGGIMHTDHVYRWASADAEPTVPAPTPTVRGPVCPAPPVAVPARPSPWGAPPSTQRPGQVYSGVGFSDLFGQVTVYPADDPDDAYTARLNSVLWVDDEVETSMRSGAILSLRDMTTFVLRENSLIRIGGQSEAEDKLVLLFGHVWANVCQIMADGSMDIEMSQAVAGIKGTTFVVADDGTTSSVTVFSGEVEMTSRATGQSVVVTGGRTVAATAAGLGAVETIDLDAHLADWDEQVRAWTLEAMAGSAVEVTPTPGEQALEWRRDAGGGTPWWPWALLAGLLGALGVSVVGVARRDRARGDRCDRPPFAG